MNHGAVVHQSRWPSLFWDARELLARDTWRRRLPDDVRTEFLVWSARFPAVTAEDFVWDALALPTMAAFGAALRQHLTVGDGLVWIQGGDTLGMDEPRRRLLFVALGCALGEPLLHYGRLYPVLDRGASYKTQSVPVSMTNAETCFHTDSSSIDVVPDFVGLLCEQPSERGGDSLVSNGLRAHAELAAQSPESLVALESPMIRDVVTPGIERTRSNLLRNRFPVFAPSDAPGGLLFRYMRYWIEVGQQKAGMPLDAREIEALDRLDAALQRPEHVIRMRLEAGDALWVNNRVLAHNRTAYEDTKDNVRRLQRMWVRSPFHAGPA